MVFIPHTSPKPTSKYRVRERLGVKCPDFITIPQQVILVPDANADMLDNVDHVFVFVSM